MNLNQVNPQSLKSYLSAAWLHPLHESSAMRTLDGVGHARYWPHYGNNPAMIKPPGTRNLKIVDQASIERLRQVTQQYFAHLPDAAISWGNDNLNLPAVGILELDDDAVGELRAASVPTFSAALVASVLSTLETAMRMVARSEAEADSARFTNVTRRMPVQGQYWNLFALRRPVTQPGQNEVAMVLLCIAPGLFGKGDFREFCGERVFPAGRLDREHPYHQETNPSPHWTAAETIWAAVYDACSVCRCEFFAVTSYDWWTFGTFSGRKMVAQPLALIPRPGITDTNGLTRPDLATFSARPSLVQMVFTWCQIARGVGPAWPLPHESQYPSQHFSLGYGEHGNIRGWAPDSTT